MERSRRGHLDSARSRILRKLPLRDGDQSERQTTTRWFCVWNGVRRRGMSDGALQIVL